MIRYSSLFAALVVFILLNLSCSSTISEPVGYSLTDEITSHASIPQSTQTHLWGYYTVTIDPLTQTASIELDRNAMFTVNVVNFLNSKPTNMGFKINSIDNKPGYTDIDIDVSLTHPFPGMNQYRGYDVRGVFMGDGSASMDYNPDLIYAVKGVDQFMLPDPLDNLGGPDGYTRWFNYSEFSGPGMPLFTYTKGKLASKGFAGTATLNPYKYFADGLGATDDVFEFLASTDKRGVFSAGMTNTRNYYLRFPTGKGIKYGYAVIANWSGVDIHPSNAPEALAVRAKVTPSLYYVSETKKGGSLILDIDVFTWDTAPDPDEGKMEDYLIYIESTVLSGSYDLDASEMTPTGGTSYSTYHVEITADNLKSAENNEFWVIVHSNKYNYTNDFGVDNLAGTDFLAALFRFDLEVSNTYEEPHGGVITFGGTGTSYVLGSNVDSKGNKYSGGYFFGDTNLDPKGNQPHPENPPSSGGRMWLNRINADGTFGWGYTWPGTAGYHSYVWGIEIDQNDNLYVCGHFVFTLDFDPGPGVDNHTASNNSGRLDAFLMKFDSNGNYKWGLSWGGSSDVTAFDLVLDKNGYLYITGYFFYTADIDPTSGVDLRTAVSASGNVSNAYLIKCDTNGNYYWGRQYGQGATVYGYDVTVDGSKNPAATGTYEGTGDFDPTSGVKNLASNGWGDTFIIKFLPDGTWQWSVGFGGNSWDQINDIAADSGNNIYVTGGSASTSVDYDPGPGTKIINGQGSYDGFLSKFDSNGNFLWVNMFAEPGHDNTWGIMVAGNGDILMCGHFNGTIDLNPGTGVDYHSSNGESDSFIVRLDSNGNYKWGNSWGGPSYESPQTVKVGGGLIHVTGNFEGTVDFDPGPSVTTRTSNGYYDTYINMLLPSGGW